MTAVVKAEVTISFPNADRIPDKREEIEAFARNLEELITVPQFCEAEVKIHKIWSDDPDACRVNIEDTWRRQ